MQFSAWKCVNLTVVGSQYVTVRHQCSALLIRGRVMKGNGAVFEAFAFLKPDPKDEVRLCT